MKRLLPITLQSLFIALYALNLAAAVKSRPNILYVFTDDQSYRTVSCYPDAYPYANTPNIDWLARHGLMFTNAITGAKCVPSRASTLTGRFQYHVGKETTRYWPQDFRDAGYTTGMIGKWHWGKGTDMHQHGVAWDWSVVWDHGQKHEHTTYYYGQSVNINGGPPVKLEGYSTDRYTDYTVEFIEQQQQSGKPWYFWLCYGAVHGPYTPAERHIGLYETGGATPVPLDIFGPRPGKPAHMNMWTKWKNTEGKPTYKNRSFDSWVKQYTEAVAAIDEGVGRIIEALRRTGQLENTVIIFTSDQGFAWGDHGLRDKRYPYDAALRNPLIFYAPDRFVSGRTCDQPVNGLDTVRTIHAIAGVDPVLQLDGRDYSALLHNPDVIGWTDEPMIHTYTNNKYEVADIEAAIRDEDWDALKFDNSPAWIMLHEGRFKYTRYLAESCIEELYDLERDPGELNNLAVASEWQTKLSQMRERTVSAFRNKGATFVDLLPQPARRP